MLCNALTIHVGAVQGVVVHEYPPAVDSGKDGVLSAHGDIIEKDIGGLTSTYRHSLLIEWELFPLI